MGCTRSKIAKQELDECSPYRGGGIRVKVKQRLKLRDAHLARLWGLLVSMF
jgi:hypothetical protein